MTSANTRRELLDIARELLQARGYSGFSFQDLADRLKIRKASIHYHFSTKSALLTALIDDYEVSFADFVQDTAGLAPRERLKRYLGIFRRYARDGNRLCPSGALSAESADLPVAIRRKLVDFQRRHHDWLTEVLSEGLQTGAFKGVSPRSEALVIGAAVQGGLQIARLHQDPHVLDRVLEAIARHWTGDLP